MQVLFYCTVGYDFPASKPNKIQQFDFANSLQFSYNRFIMLLNASLDTSFWNIANQIGVTPYLFDFFRIYYCQAVRNEIITTDPNETNLVYPQAMAFLIAEEDGRLQRQDPQYSLNRFGAGEAYASALALEKNWTLLINDYRPLVFSQSLGIACVSVPDFCVLLYAEGKITYGAVQGYLARLSVMTSLSLIRQAEQTLAQIMIGQQGAQNDH